MSKENQDVSLEETFQELDAIIEKMQDREVTLEDSFFLYEQGIRKLKYCNEKIDSVEKRMLLLNEQGELEAFDE
ncbi:MAG: exodeoxyribonuclease VII small subunit [Lachnospiraceae bacterium]|mgnify:CR=1 FL=1|nr:exodeoxyribonuclease VII small subunit [Lachnospiraceae bacterium]